MGEYGGSASEECGSMGCETKGSDPLRTDAECSKVHRKGNLRKPRRLTGVLRTGGLWTNLKCSELGGAQLLPGIPNEITVDQICTKLPWNAFGILSSVSSTWRTAVLTRRIYDARVRSQSTETLMVHSHPFELDFSCEQLHVYSGREKRCYELPQIDGCQRGIPWECQCVSLDGTIYVLGGGTGYGYACESEDDEDKKNVFNRVYALELLSTGRRAGMWGWKRCASMQEGRLKFGCGVIGGKIYVFGGSSHYGPVHGCEVYDPKADTWSPIKPMKRLRFGHQVAILGGVFLVFGGEVFDEGYAGGQRGNGTRLLDEDGYRVPNSAVRDALVLDAYHPGKDEWREVGPFQKPESETMFTADGKIHLMTQLGVFAQDTETSSWKELHSHAFPVIGRSDEYKVTLGDSVVVSDALYVNVRWECKRSRTSEDFLCEGRGFGSDNIEIVWEELDCVAADGESRVEWKAVKCPIKL